MPGAIFARGHESASGEEADRVAELVGVPLDDVVVVEVGHDSGDVLVGQVVAVDVHLRGDLVVELAAEFANLAKKKWRQPAAEWALMS